jgi:hypothetical protein
MAWKDKAAKAAYHKEYMRRRYANDPEFRARHLARVAKNDARYHAMRKALIAAFRADGCLLCDEKTPCCLVAHHVDPAKKEHNIANMVRSQFSTTKIAKELMKCVCLCENCHRKLHNGLIALPDGLNEDTLRSGEEVISLAS